MYDTDRCAGMRALIFLVFFLFFSTACREAVDEPVRGEGAIIVTSDTILSGMVRSLLPSEHFRVSAILPPRQCPGHYDTKPSDIRRVEEADLVVSFRDLPFMEKVQADSAKCIRLDRQGQNWMEPGAYIRGLHMLASALEARFPRLADQIEDRLEGTVRELNGKAAVLLDGIERAGIAGRPVLASSMQREPLEWMRLRVVGDYGRPESMSVREAVRLSGLGRREGVVLVVDNLQSGPDAGRGIAEDLGVPRVVLSNFPLEEGYAATLSANVAAVLEALQSDRPD